ELGADGSFRFTLDNTLAATQALNAGQVVSETFTYTIVDGDGDTDTATLTLRVAGTDDGVVLGGLDGAGGEITVSDANLSDGSAANPALLTQTGSFTFSAPDGAQSLTVGGSALISGGVLAGTLPTLTSGLGNTLTITGVDYDPATGSGTVFYSYTLLDNEMHTQPANDTALSESFAVVLVDDSGTTIGQSLDVTILDDVPQAFLPEYGMLIDQVSDTRTISGDLRFADAAGADGVGDVGFTFAEGALALDANGNRITLDDQQLYLYYGDDNTQLVAKTGPNGDAGFVIDIDPETDSYSLTTYGVLSNHTSTVLSNLSGVGSAGNINFKGLIDVGGTQQDVLMSSTSGSINSTPTDVAIGNQWIDPADNIRFDFLNGLVVNAQSSTGFSYSSHNLFSSFRQSIAQVQSSNGTVSLTILAIIADNDNVFGSGDVGESYVPLSTSNIHVYDKLGNDVTSSVTLVDNGDSITIRGLLEDWSYEVSSATQFSALQVSAASDSSPFALGGFSYTQVLPEQPIELSYQIEATDGDGDTIFSSLQATLYPQASTLEGDDGSNSLAGTAAADWIFGHGGDDSLSGLIGDDALSGGGGNDILDGGQGNDLLSGGTGADSFVWNSGDTGVDRITDFTPSEDQLDLSDLLMGVDGALDSPELASSLTDYLSMAFGASTTITVNPDAAGPLPANQSIVLEGVDLSQAYGSSDEATIIQGMLDDGSLKVV
ncbi:MAG: type I secretion C-terminal target domain-containing protein, partial [Pseudomonas sp.]|nr:type I secretion C-terminal target domain-containing protein [Pseudomonas sp.]